MTNEFVYVKQYKTAKGMVDRFFELREKYGKNKIYETVDLLYGFLLISEVKINGNGWIKENKEFVKDIGWLK